MPELPEVEVTCRGLSKVLKLESSGSARPVKSLRKSSKFTQIQEFKFARKDLRFAIPIKQLRSLQGAQLLRIHRRAKYLLFETDKGMMVSHLGMTGTWSTHREFGSKLHDHVCIIMSDGESLIYNDPRRFGFIDFVKLGSLLEQHVLFKHLGVEPLSDNFDLQYLYQKLRNKQQPIKAAIMDQRIVVGVGNIYASEALFMAQISPLLAAHKLSKLRLQKLVLCIRQVLQTAIDHGGSSISDFTGAGGKLGYFQNSHQVYDRHGEGCVVCKQQIKSKVIAGRNTFWCPRCQKS